MRIRSEDTVQVIRGNDRGKRGRVLRVDREGGMVVVEGVRMLTRHVRKSQKSPQGGRLQKEGPIPASNVQVVCPGCSKPSRMGRKRRADGRPVRVCRRCKTELG